MTVRPILRGVAIAASAALLVTVLAVPVIAGVDAKYTSHSKSAVFGLGSSPGFVVGSIRSVNAANPEQSHRSRQFSSYVAGAPECIVNGASFSPNAFQWTPNGATFDTVLDGCGRIHLEWVGTGRLVPMDHFGYTIGDICSGEVFSNKYKGTGVGGPALVSGNIGVHEVPEGTEGFLSSSATYEKFCGLP